MRLLSIITIAIVLVISSCTPKPELKTGSWRGLIEEQGKKLPFTFDVVTDSSGKKNIYLKNAGEKILLDEIIYDGDSMIITLHIFDSELKAKLLNDHLTGFFIKNYEKDYRLPFRASFGEDFRFVKNNGEGVRDFSGKYSATFIHKSDTTLAVGIFKQNGNHAEGTFLTTTGDYRYLEGNVIHDTLRLSTFDGNHAYLFSAVEKDDHTLQGDYWSGKSWHETWTAVKNDSAALPDAGSLTHLKEGYDRIDFSFPDVAGKIIHPTDEKYKNKVLIVQLFGTWCPNCMDETKFLAPWYKQNKKRGIEIIGLAYERKNDFDYARGRVQKMKTKLSVEYDFVIAGTSDKAKASETLPMLNGVMAFPTTIFIGKDGKVKKIHTGFSGPGTGVYYDRFIQDFNETVNELLK